MTDLKKIRADISYTRYPMPNFRKITIEFFVPKDLNKEQTENKIINTVKSCNSEITKDAVKEVKYKEVKSG